MPRNKDLSAYRNQRGHAKARTIPWKLTFKQWLKFWTDSGHYHERGRKFGQYVMARFGDQGPYVLDNIKIILHTENSKEWVRTEKYRRDMSDKNRGRKHTEAARQAISRACKGMIRANNKKLNEAEVSEIRQLYAEGLTQCVLAKKYGVGQTQISNVINRKAWEHVP